VRQEGGFEAHFPLDVPMVSSSVIIVTTNSECLMYGGFSLGETVSFGNFEFITDYISGLSLSPRRGDASVIRLNS
jgi:hypothetical protein